MAEQPAILAEGLRKYYGNVKALDGVDLTVPAGTVLGLLGPNGAGKTTAVRILTTLLRPDHGRAEVAGYDVVRDAQALRSVIGLAGQFAAIDENLSGRENLELVGRLYHMPRAAIAARATELLERFTLADAADRLAKTYSGGMRRRLDLAASLMSRPQVLFLDEPTTGLDPRSRNDLWDMLRDLVRDGTTIILTTQYLEEADRLADDVIVLDHGVTVAHGTPADLKAQIGGDRVEVRATGDRELERIVDATRSFAIKPAFIEPDSATVIIPVASEVRLIDVMRAVDEAGIDVLDVNRRQATLDDVFLTLTSKPGTRQEVLA